MAIEHGARYKRESNVQQTIGKCSVPISFSRQLQVQMFPIIIRFVLGVTLAATKLDQAQQKAILEVHNQLRSSLALGNYTAKGKKQPSATNMKKMVWSSEIADSAQAAANKCKFAHTQGGPYGENIWAYSGKSFDGAGAKASKSWENEFQEFGIKDLKLTSAVFSTGIGHATQMAWANSEKIGCGAIVCDSGKFPTLLFCQYSPRGNYLNSFIYEAGPTCSKCDDGFVCEKATGLCVRK